MTRREFIECALLVLAAKGMEASIPVGLRPLLASARTSFTRPSLADDPNALARLVLEAIADRLHDYLPATLVPDTGGLKHAHVIFHGEETDATDLVEGLTRELRSEWRRGCRLVCSELPLPQGLFIVSRATSSKDALSVRVLMDYDILADDFLTRIDLLYGWVPV